MQWTIFVYLQWKGILPCSFAYVQSVQCPPSWLGPSGAPSLWLLAVRSPCYAGCQTAPRPVNYKKKGCC